MKHFRQILEESRKLTVFEMLRKLEGFLKEKYNLKSFGVKEDNGIVLYMSKYLGDAETKDLTNVIFDFAKKECGLENVSVRKDIYGYHITFGHDAEAAKLIEVTQADASGISGAKRTYVCTFCKKDFEGWGNDPWPVDMEPGHRACNHCNSTIVIPARLDDLYKRQSKKEAVQKHDVEHAASNIILDDKFIWRFNVLDKNGRDIEEGIEYLQDAIDSLIKHNAAFLVAFPYVDPKPNDPNVELVFADNPGPTIIYNNEEVTIPKSVSRPSKERQDKPEEETVETEEVVEESTRSDFYGWREGTEEADDLLFALQYFFGLPEFGYDDFRDLSLSKRDIRNALQSVADSGTNKHNFFNSTQSDGETINEAVKNEERNGIYFFAAKNGNETSIQAVQLAAISYFTGQNKFTDKEVDYVFCFETYIDVQSNDESVIKSGLYKIGSRTRSDGLDEYYLVPKSRNESVTEAIETDEDYAVTIDFTNMWYEMFTDDRDSGVTIYEIIREHMISMEEYLYDYDIFVNFDYAGQRNYDIISNFMSQEDAEYTEALLEGYLEDGAVIRVIKKPE